MGQGRGADGAGGGGGVTHSATPEWGFAVDSSSWRAYYERVVQMLCVDWGFSHRAIFQLFPIPALRRNTATVLLFICSIPTCGAIQQTVVLFYFAFTIDCLFISMVEKQLQPARNAYVLFCLLVFFMVVRFERRHWLVHA